MDRLLCRLIDFWRRVLKRARLSVTRRSGPVVRPSVDKHYMYANWRDVKVCRPPPRRCPMWTWMWTWLCRSIKTGRLRQPGHAKSRCKAGTRRVPDGTWISRDASDLPAPSDLSLQSGSQEAEERRSRSLPPRQAKRAQHGSLRSLPQFVDAPRSLVAFTSRRWRSCAPSGVSHDHGGAGSGTSHSA